MNKFRIGALRGKYGLLFNLVRRWEKITEMKLAILAFLFLSAFPALAVHNLDDDESGPSEKKKSLRNSVFAVCIISRTTLKRTKGRT